MRHALRALLCLLFSLLVVSPAHAFDYLEHSYFTDRSCRLAQEALAERASQDETVAARYLALSLTCPERWDRPYCAGGYKQLEGSLNRLEAPPAETGDHAITLGDLAALPDHLSAFGPIRSVPQAQARGLTQRLLEWLITRGDAGGVVSDVAEDACETDAVDWSSVERDVETLRAPPSPDAVSAWLTSAYSLPARGPVDPSGAYSFDNPQYLDLVLSNHNHFGRQAHASWLGYHTAAVAVMARPCSEVLALDGDDLEELADELPPFDAIDFDALEGEALRRAGCAVVAERARLRVLEWAARAAPDQVAPVRAWVEQLSQPPSAARERFAESLVSPLIALVLEGAGLHFLQDGFSGGHARMERAAHGLEDSRHVHDSDGAMGVMSTRGTASGVESFVAFGDGYLLGTAPGRGEACSSTELDADEVSACLLQRQRLLVTGSTLASIIDWALGGEATPRDDCGAPHSTLHAFVCSELPTRPTLGAGLVSGAPPTRLEPGTPPSPPPPFSYQSILVGTGVDLRGGPPQLGVRAQFLSALGSRANWMTSYDLGLLTTLGSDAHLGVQTEFAYRFHWRWAARFLLHAGPFAFSGFRGLRADAALYGGVGPTVGMTLLPEGWIRMPLEATLTWRAPVTVLDSKRGVGLRVDAHYLELALGLAFF